MKSFAFSLERVLEWRGTQMRMEEARLQQLQQAVTQLDQRRRHIEEERVSGQRAVCRAAESSGAELGALAGYQIHSRMQLAKLAANRVECVQAVDAQRQRFTEARRQLKLLENLKQRRKAEWKDQFDKELEELASEAFLASWARLHTG